RQMRECGVGPPRHAAGPGGRRDRADHLRGNPGGAMENDDVTSPERPPPIRKTWLRVGLGMAFVLALALIGAGYLIGSGHRAASPAAARASAAPAAPAAGPGDVTQYVACMRTNGVGNFPQPSPGGRLRISAEDG